VLANGDLVSGSGDWMIQTWDWKSGKPKKLLRGHPHWIRVLVPLPNNKLVSSTEDYSIRLWHNLD
jgi:WD40 repeat protein